eukprot:6455761-Amphidinium_carterae.1
MVPSKGIGHPFNVSTLVSMLLQLPHNKIILKSDDEESIKALKHAAAAEMRVKHGKEILEVVAPDSASNGLAEGAARDIKATARTLLHGASTMHGAGVIPARHAVVPWAVRYAGAVMTLAQVGLDGRTAYERMWDKKTSRQMIPFSEQVMYHTPGPSRAEPKWEKGIFLGLAHKGMYYVGLDGKVVTTRTVRRLAPSERNNRNLLNMLKGTPWAPTPGEIHLPEAVRTGPEVEADADARASNAEDTSVRKHRTYLRRDKELRDYGYTKNCPGCEAARLGLPARGHSEVCRKRIEEEMRATAKGRDRLEITEDKLRIRHDEEMVETPVEPASGASGSGSAGPVPMSFADKRRQQDTGVARVVTRKVEEQERTPAQKREAEELERERTRARLGSLLSRVGCGPWPQSPTYFTIPAVCDLRSERVDDKPHAKLMLADMSNINEVDLQTMRLFAINGGQVAVGIGREHEGTVVAAMEGKDNDFRAVDVPYPDNEEDDCVVVLNKCGNQLATEMEGQILGLTTRDIVANDEYKRVEEEAERLLPPVVRRDKLRSGNLRSQLYGAYAKQGFGIADATWKGKSLVYAVHKLIRKSNPEIESYTSFVVNCMEVGSTVCVHRDRTNLPGTCVWTVSFGSFSGKGGRLWRFDTAGHAPPPSDKGDAVPPNAKGTLTSTYRQWVKLHGEGWHAVETPSVGTRWSLSVFTPQSIQRLEARHWDDLESLGFPVKRLRRLHNDPSLRELRMEWKLARVVLAAIGVDETSMEAGPHMDEADPWLAHPELYQDIHDNISGKPLPGELVAVARRQEMEFLKQLGAYSIVPIKQCYDSTGKRPIPCGWVDVNKGDEKAWNVRSRLVVKETKYNSNLTLPSEIYSSTPPYEALRFLMSYAMTRQNDDSLWDRTVMFLDITRTPIVMSLVSSM